MFRILRNIDLNLLTIFEAVYVHKGIVNAAKILNITPSAISQSLNKLRALFPDPLFIRKGQGVTPTAYATHLHKHISEGMEAFLNALDLTGNTQRERVITVATSPAIGALIMPVITKKLRSVFPQILLHNVAITDAASQLNQRQVDLLVDSFPTAGRRLRTMCYFRIAYISSAGQGIRPSRSPQTQQTWANMNSLSCSPKDSAIRPSCVTCRSISANAAMVSVAIIC